MPAAERSFVDLQLFIFVHSRSQRLFFHLQGYEDAQSRQAIVSVRRELQQMLRSPLLMTEYGGRYPTMLGHFPEPVLRPGQAKNLYSL
jgi:hypothetical protein